MSTLMTFDFTESLPEFHGEPIVISGTVSMEFPGKEFVVLRNGGNIILVFEIRFESHCTSFRQAKITDGFLAVGHEEHFYLYDLTQKTTICAFKMFGYFGHFYNNNHLWYVADAGGIYCINKKGILLWKNERLGIDGVLINSFDDTHIYGTGEWDPPGGWKEFVLDKQTGASISTH